MGNIVNQSQGCSINSYELKPSKRGILKSLLGNTGNHIALQTSLIFALLFGLVSNKIYAQKPEQIGGLPPPTQKTEVKEARPEFIGSVYGEGGIYRGIFDESSGLGSLIWGYNIQDKELNEGVLLLPSFRMLARGTVPDYPWSNSLDTGVGATYLKPPFVVGIEGVYRESFMKEGIDKFFARVWGGYWDAWRLKGYEKGKEPSLSQFQDGIWGTNYFEFSYDGFEKDLAAYFRTDANLDLVKLADFIVGPYVKLRFNYDVKNEPWYRFGEFGGGIRIRRGPINVFIEMGHRESFNDKGVEGSYSAIYAGLWFPL